MSIVPWWGWVLLGGLAIAVGVWLLGVPLGKTSKRRSDLQAPGQTQAAQGDKPDGAALMRELLGGQSPRQPGASTAGPTTSSGSGHGFMARQALDQVAELNRQNAQWPLILGKLNPGQDAQLAHLLQEIRGPHLFAPHLGLSVMKTALEQVLQSNPQATFRDGLIHARRTLKQVTGFGD